LVAAIEASKPEELSQRPQLATTIRLSSLEAATQEATKAAEGEVARAHEEAARVATQWETETQKVEPTSSPKQYSLWEEVQWSSWT
jgi:hypothetical protein